MQLGHWLGTIPEEILPPYQDADLREVYIRLAAKHKAYPAEESDNT